MAICRTGGRWVWTEPRHAGRSKYLAVRDRAESGEKVGAGTCVYSCPQSLQTMEVDPLSPSYWAS